MAASRASLSQSLLNLSRSSLRPESAHCRATCLASVQIRHASQKSSASKSPQKSSKDTKKKKAQRKTYKIPDLKLAEKFALCDAMQYIKAFEVGRDPVSAKYEVHVRLRGPKNGPVVRNRLQLPNPVKTETKIAVIAPTGSKAAIDAKAAGAWIVGEEEIFSVVREGKVEFDRCICHTDSVQKLNAAKVARILGPRGMMPNAKTGTISDDVVKLIKNMVGGSEYRERDGVLRVAIGQLAFTPDQLAGNLKSFLDRVKADMGDLSDRVTKSIHEVVLSSTQSPGFTLNGELRSPDSVPAEHLSLRH